MPQIAKGARLYLRKRKGRDAVWVIRCGPDEIGTGCGAGDVAGAHKALEAYLARTFRADTSQRDLAAISVAEVLTLYAAELPADSPSRATIGYHIKALLPYWNGKTLAGVKGSACRAYVASRPVQASTARQELKTLQAAINHWHRESPLAAVPKVTLPKTAQPRERVLDRKEAASLLAAARALRMPHVARFILIGLYTGTRHEALLKLRWQPSLAGGHPDLARGILYRRGSAERETSKRRPPVRIGARLAGHLARWKTIDGGDGPVIHYHGAPIARMKKAWKACVTRAGLSADVTPHTLRHTCASWALWNGATIWDTAGLIGADASTVEKVYGHHQPLDMKAARRA